MDAGEVRIVSCSVIKQGKPGNFRDLSSYNLIAVGDNRIGVTDLVWVRSKREDKSSKRKLSEELERKSSILCEFEKKNLLLSFDYGFSWGFFYLKFQTIYVSA